MSPQHRTAPTVDPRDLPRSEQAPVILDVRSVAEFEAAHIDGSCSFPLPLLERSAAEVVERLQGRRVVLVCQTGVRAEQARRSLAAAGAEVAQVLAGGVSSWPGSGGELVRGAQRWAMERQVRMVAGSLVLSGLLGARVLSPRLRAVSWAVGTGLTFSAVTDTCAMARALSAMPWNPEKHEPTVAEALRQIPEA